MDTNQMKQYEMLVRVNQFGETHGDLFRKTNQARQHFAGVAVAVKELSGYTIDKMRATDEGKSNKASGRLALASRLRTISRTARMIAADNPGMEDKFNYPKPQSDQALIVAGRLFAQDAEAFAGAFVAQVMPKTFIADLKALVDRFEQAIQDRDANKEAHAAARLKIAAALRSGTLAVRKLDTIMSNHPLGDPDIVELWRRERKVVRPRRVRFRGQAGAEPAPVAEPATPASQPEPAPSDPASTAVTINPDPAVANNTDKKVA